MRQVGTDQGSRRTADIPLRMSALHLDVFHAVVMMGGVTAASRHLNLSQPAVSRRLADLERALGFDLFIRDGKASHHHVGRKGLSRGVGHLLRGTGTPDQGGHGHSRTAPWAPAVRLHVGHELRTRDTGHRCLLRPAPDIKISHETYTASRIEDALTANLLDLAVGMLPKDSAGIETIASFRAACVCVMRPDHPLAAREVVRAGTSPATPPSASARNGDRTPAGAAS